MDINCTNQLFGISENECDCYTDELNDVTPAAPDWYKESVSGLFLDELECEGLVPMRASEGTLTCDKTLGTFYKTAQAQAIKRINDDVYTVISQRYTNKRETFSGRIGGNKSNKGLLIPGAAIAGVLLSPFPIVDGVFRLRSITINSSVTRTDLVLSIYSFRPGMNEDPELVETITDVTTVAGRSTTKVLDDIIELPLEIDKEFVEYLIIYSMEAGEVLQNTSISCGCGRKEYLFNTYARYAGITIKSDAPSLANFDKTGGYSYGISLDGEFTCNSSSIVCRMFNSSDAWKKVFAYAARYLAAAMVNESVYKSPDLTRWSLVNYDEVKASAYNFRGEYQTRITWLAQNTDPSVNDCYKCDTQGMRKSGILS